MEDAGAGGTCCDALAKAMGRDRFELWLADAAEIRLVNSGDSAGVVHVVFSSGFMCDIARRNIGSELESAVKRLYGSNTTTLFRVDETVAATRPVNTTAATADPDGHVDNGQVSSVGKAKLASNGNQQTGSSPAHSGGVPTPNKQASKKQATFQTLVVGKSNQLAASAAMQLAEGRRTGGPLVVCGPPGCGKTHLLSALKHAYVQKFRRQRVLSLSAEQFVGTYVQALRGGGLPSFRQKYRGADLLILDDLHFMAGKRASLEELQHTLDRVHAAGGQVVAASCHEPTNIANLGDELLSRLRAGLTCQVTTADYATRLEIARRRFDELGLPIEAAALHQLASSVSSGARELLGAIERLRAQHELLGEPITASLVEATAGVVNSQTIRPMAMDEIQKAVCDYFGVDTKTLRSNSRRKSVTEPRMLAMWLTRKYTQAGWREIGDFFGGRSHSTVISAHRRIESQMTSGNNTSTGVSNCQLEDAVVQIETALRMA